MGVGPPRLNPYNKILSRLFEFLALFCILKKVDGPHSITLDPPNLQARRRFLRNLCFICDYQKGGDTTTAIAVQARPVKFWVAMNSTPNYQALAFLAGILDELKGVPEAPEAEHDSIADVVKQKCASFAAPRLKKECKILSNAARDCEKYLEAHAADVQTPGVAALIAWLPRFKFKTGESVLPLCQTAYNVRHDPQMETLEALRNELSVAPEKITKALRTVKHFIGRLSERIRVPRILVQDACQLGALLNTYQIGRVEAPTAAKVPQADGLTNLDSILKRMLTAGDPRLEEMRSYLSWLDGPTGLGAAIRVVYDEDCAKPRVHAEIQMLEHFHRNELEFMDRDRYIACSKLACLSCKFYFRHHPGRFVEPNSHQKAYLNWRPVLLPDGSQDQYWHEQRPTLAWVSKEFSRAVEEQITSRQQPAAYQADSITNITASIDSALDLSDVGDEFLSDRETSDDTASLRHLHTDDTDEDSCDSDDGSEGGVSL
ncbi:hypothetical protein FZEAL_3104 [Fusarium zealandicum]|uniref:Uncharacterized protein n=1 Tax=Fusarium zealandicum TaxID=1053134 RepID=A0A8H4XMW0_9HYPO|nr:hypothetical protein FZEAL_3104 [Fusarium zealandicum]